MPTLVGFVAPRSLVCEQVENLLGRSRSALIRPFPADLAVSLLTVPRPLWGRGSSSLELFIPFSVHVRSPAPYPLRALAFRPSPGEPASASLGFSPSSRPRPTAALISASHCRIRVLSRVTPVGTCPFGLSVLDVLHALDVLLRYRSCGLVSSRCRVQGLSFRGLFLDPGPFRVSPVALPSCR